MRRLFILTLALTALALALALSGRGNGATASGRFQLTPVISGLDQPTAVAFAKDGRVFVAEKQGQVFVYRSLSDHHPRLLVDVSKRVDSYWDRGLLSIALDPDFPKKPYLYLLYSLDAPPGQSPPVWHDTCPDPPGGMRDGCVDTGVVSRVRVSAADTSGAEHVLVKDRWCHQFTSHDVGDLVFGPGRALYVSAGEGSNWAGLDYGQYGGSPGSPTPKNPCADPPGGSGATLAPPAAQGGALRAQDLMTQGDPVSYDGALIRISPDTGRALSSDPLYGGKVSDDDAVVSFGFRNPYRLAVSPSGDVYVADVGWARYDEIDVVHPGHVGNYGWPCYEGPYKQPVFAASGLSICQELYAGQRGYTKAPLVAPFYSYRNSFPPYSACDGRGSAVSGLAFYAGRRYPPRYRGALFFSDYAGRCLYAMLSPHGRPSAKDIVLVATNVTPVDLKTGPQGDVFAVDIAAGQLLRLQYFRGDRPPLVSVQASKDAGPLPLSTTLMAQATDADGGPLRYSWDLNGDGRFGDAYGKTAHHRFRKRAVVAVSVRVSDRQGLSSEATLKVYAGDTPPTPVIDAPTAGYQFKANEYLLFSGHATDAEEGTLSPAHLTWTFLLHHCTTPGHCHVHYLEQRPGGDSGGLTAPDHGWPNFLEIDLTATDAQGASSTVRRDVYPLAVHLHVVSDPTGVKLVVGDVAKRAPFDYTADAEGAIPVAAPKTVTVSGNQYVFSSWSDGGAQDHTVKLGDSDQTLLATYRQR